jgi:hypothetical protein
MNVKQMEESLTGRVAIEHLSENNLGSLIPGIVYGKAKRFFDFVAAAIALPCWPCPCWSSPWRSGSIHPVRLSSGNSEWAIAATLSACSNSALCASMPRKMAIPGSPP